MFETILESRSDILSLTADMLSVFSLQAGRPIAGPRKRLEILGDVQCFKRSADCTHMHTGEECAKPVVRGLWSISLLTINNPREANYAER